jgi:glycerophosphoryl diester phosphodiesterase
MPLNIAHRGGADLWPENTLPAFEGAIASGADGAELDVHLSADGDLVVFHDETLKPEIVRAGGAWITDRTPLKNLTCAELATYDAGTLKPGTSYAARHPRQAKLDGVKIPRLAEVIALARSRSKTFQLWIELKTDLMHPENGADPIQLAEAAVALVQQMDFAQRTVFVSFDWRALYRVHQLSAAIPFYATTLPQSWFAPGAPPPEHGPPREPELSQWRAAHAAGAPWEAGFHAKDHGSLQAAIAALGATGWFPFWPDLTPESVRRAEAAGLKLAAWTPPIAETASLVALGCNAICSDDPVALGQALAGGQVKPRTS